MERRGGGLGVWVGKERCSPRYDLTILIIIRLNFEA
jgi:hypothetical protein